MKFRFYTTAGISGTFSGTTFSGSPFRTTLFNTMRNYFYIRTFASHHGIQKYHSFCAGDDLLISIESGDEVAWKKLPSWLGKKNSKKGLGQNLTDFKIGPLTELNFLSL
jgi:hypothetical protein